MDDFIKFDGEYEKQFYDIVLYNGKFIIDGKLKYNRPDFIIEHCWPNAGKFHTPDGTVIDGEDVYKYRRSRNQGE